MVRRVEIHHLELDVLGVIVVFCPKVTGRTTDPSGVAALPGMMP
jgi:hypothetical protein